MTTMVDLERRLRLPAPDEPKILPALVLPTDATSVGGARTTRFRMPLAEPLRARTAYAIVLLLLLLAAIVVAGALRQLDHRTLAVEYLWSESLDIDLPNGWERLAEGQRFPGDFNQPDLAYEIVVLVAANTDLGCDPDATIVIPTPVETGEATVYPQSPPDQALVCLREARLPDGAIRLRLEVGYRSQGLATPEGPAISDLSEPTPANGWTTEVDGRPARLTVTAGDRAESGVAETRTWDVMLPNRVDQILRVRADLAGPDLAAARAEVERIVRSIDFAIDAPRLALDDARNVLRTSLDRWERNGREAFRSDFMSCFPRDPGTRTATISAGPSIQLDAPVEVRCSSSITPSAAGVWRISLEATWPAGDGYPAGRRTQEAFVDAAGVDAGGHVLRSDGSPLQGPEDEWLPTPPRTLPAPLDGPLGIPGGSIVEILWPGYVPADTPGESAAINPSSVGWRAYVLDSPTLVDGIEWYPVQYYDPDLSPITAWLPGTVDGRPVMARTEPACPTDPTSMTDLVMSTPAERLLCLADRRLELDRVTLVRSDRQAMRCSDESGTTVQCPYSMWLMQTGAAILYGPTGPDGSIPGLWVWFDPDLVAAPPFDTWLRLAGHFDHPAASECRPFEGGEDLTGEWRLLCRERFVITGFEPVVAP